MEGISFYSNNKSSDINKLKSTSNFNLWKCKDDSILCIKTVQEKNSLKLKPNRRRRMNENKADFQLDCVYLRRGGGINYFCMKKRDRSKNSETQRLKKRKKLLRLSFLDWLLKQTLPPPPPPHSRKCSAVCLSR